LSKAVDATWQKAEVKNQLATLGGEAKTVSPVPFARYIEEESAKFARAVKLSGAKVE
jgi:tripartite-type tricarboxylate transporter receptor subunit TctC